MTRRTINASIDDQSWEYLEIHQQALGLLAANGYGSDQRPFRGLFQILKLPSGKLT
jgi:hypothetical protein